MGIKIKIMPQFIANHLEGWFYWLTALAIVLPVLGGLAGWGAWVIGDRLDVSRSKESADELRDTKEQLTDAKKEATEARALAEEIRCQRSPKVHHLWSLQSAPPFWDKTSP